MQVNLHHKDIFKSFSSSSGAGMNLFSSSWEAAATLRFFLIRCLFHRLRRRPAARADYPSFAIWFEHHGAKQISSKLFPESKMKAFISLCGARRWQPTEAHTQRWIHGSEKCDKLQQKQHWFDPTRPVEWYESEFCKEEKEINQQSHVCSTTWTNLFVPIHEKTSRIHCGIMGKVWNQVYHEYWWR